MGTPTLTLSCLLLCLGQVGQDIWYTNERVFEIPINMTPALKQEIKGLVLYVSANKGGSWEEATRVTPEAKSFVVRTPTDGEFWYRVACINRAGNQDPPNIFDAPETKKIIVDTLRPNIRLVKADRQGDDVLIRWEIQENNPDTATMRLRYRPAGQPNAPWSDPVPVPLRPSDEVHVKVNTASALTFRLELKDRAGNFGYDEKGVAGDLALTNFQTPAPAKINTTTAPGLTEAPALPAAKGPPPPPPPFPSAPPAAPGQADPQVAWESGGNGPKPFVADSSAAPKYDPPAAPSGMPPSPMPPAGKSLPPIQIVNNPKVVVEYKLSNVGPAGVGSIELWMTRDDGQTWQPWAKDDTASKSMHDGKYTRTLSLPSEGVYGLTLVVYNQIKRGKPPVPGELPQMRVELDMRPPTAALLAPEPDPQQRDAVLLTWEAKDKNLSSTPITLEWAERANGPWNTIDADLPNTGRYSWQVRAGTPAYVFLRLRVRDKAGNEGIAVTSQPQPVDMSEPEGQLTGVSLSAAGKN